MHLENLYEQLQMSRTKQRSTYAQDGANNTIYEGNITLRVAEQDGCLKNICDRRQT